VPRRLITLAAVAAVSVLATVGLGSATSSATTSAGPAAVKPIRVLVTNDDGFAAPGIDKVVQALRKMTGVTVIVVAPKKNQSGSGSKTTKGKFPAVTNVKTASGYPAKAVAGFPADTIVWAIDKKGVLPKPDVVISGANEGQNIGREVIDISGTVGAARAAAQRGIPALAVSAGLGVAPAKPDYATTAKQAVAWLTKNRAGLSTAKATVTNLNVPTCPSGKQKPVVVVKIAIKSGPGYVPTDCVTASPKPTTDVGGFPHGYIVQTNNVSLKPPAK
jgi:5'-nucleotidase